MSTTLSELDQRLAALAARYEEIRLEGLARYALEIERAPVSNCPQHPGQALRVDLEKSTFLSAQYKRLVVSHHECPLCVDTAQRVAFARKLAAKGVPASSLGITLETWNPAWEASFAQNRTIAWKAVDAWCKTHPHPFLVILGRTGVGKTSLGVAACRALPADFRVIDVRPWLNDVLSLEQRQRQARINLVKRYPVLMLDDFGARSIGARDAAGGNPFERDTIGEIIGHRYEERLPTIITGNLTPKAFAGRLDDKAVGRIRGGRTLIDASNWPSRREINNL